MAIEIVVARGRVIVTNNVSVGVSRRDDASRWERSRGSSYASQRPPFRLDRRDGGPILFFLRVHFGKMDVDFLEPVLSGRRRSSRNSVVLGLLLRFLRHDECPRYRLRNGISGQ